MRGARGQRALVTEQSPRRNARFVLAEFAGPCACARRLRRRRSHCSVRPSVLPSSVCFCRPAVVFSGSVAR
eukprot:11191012-Lingulodinium_polyedra.AAC.1